MFWLKKYAESDRKRPGSSAAHRLDKRLLVKQRQNARRTSSAAATEESTEDILQSLSRATVTKGSIGEALPGPPFPSQERAGSSEAAVEKPFTCEHSAFYQQTAIDAAAQEFAKGLARRKSSSNQAKKGPCPVLPRPKLDEIKRRTVPESR